MAEQHCSRCKVSLTDDNAYRRKGTKYFCDLCKKCNKDVGFIRRYVRSGEAVIRKTFDDYQHKISLLAEAYDRRQRMMVEHKHKIKIIFDLPEVQEMIEDFLEKKERLPLPENCVLRARRGSASVIVDRLEISYETTKKEGDQDHG